MARSRKKPSAGAASNAKATRATDEPSAGDALAKDPVARKAAGAAGATPSRKTPTTPGGDVTEQAKDSTRSTSARKAAAAESARTTGRRVAAAGQNPAWLAPTAVTLLIIGLLYLVTYYLSSGMLPLPIGDWNLAVGFGVLMVGGGILMFWK
ncbi:cell division protein CrgA [Brachybacterium sp. UNK5269]|uniref:cell division protein CrgA n=1 Tax=Brachybacterium sp. UNK5269 TaxID=3408576 RepID=UPI003BB145E0